MSKSLYAAALACAIGAFALNDARADEALFKAKACNACHVIGDGNKTIGPRVIDVAAKYKDDAGAIDKLVGKVRNGGVGVWGQIPMPSNNVTVAEAESLVKWMLGR